MGFVTKSSMMTDYKQLFWDTFAEVPDDLSLVGYFTPEGILIEIVRDECNIMCMTAILVVINNCLDFIKLINIDIELENVIKWCYYKKVISGEYLGNGH